MAKKREHLVDLGVDVRAILKWILIVVLPCILISSTLLLSTNALLIKT
jgi:hypothetical protein